MDSYEETKRWCEYVGFVPPSPPHENKDFHIYLDRAQVESLSNRPLYEKGSEIKLSDGNVTISIDPEEAYRIACNPRTIEGCSKFRMK